VNVAEPFIRRPIATTLVMVGILVAGVVGYRALPVSDLPTVDYPTISVSAGLPGASPETMAAAVATPLEKEFSTIPGIDNITSTSSQGSANITLQFSLDRNIDAAAQDVQTAIAQTLRRLPQGMQPPSYRKANPAAFPIMFYVLSSPTLPLSTVDEYAETVLAQRISTIDGVAQVNVFGAQKYAVRIQLDPRALAYRRIGIDEVVQAVASNNVNLPTGVLWGHHKTLTVQANGQLADAVAFRPIIVAYRNGSPVRLQDLGQVLDGVENPRSAHWYNGERTISLAIQRQPGSNTVKVADAVRRTVEQLRDEIPGSIQINLLWDRATSIRESVRDVRFTLMLTLCLVVMVIFLFLRNLSATVIPSLALPMSLIATFAVMALLGYSVDNLSLMALTLAVGFVVDDAIVMLENIVRHMESGKPALQAALDGSREVGFTIVSMTLSLTAVFIPLLFMGGLLGRLFHEFAVTIGVAILVSGFVSLTLTPMLSGRFLKPHDAIQHGRLFNASERVYQRVLGFYERTLLWVMHHRRATLAFSGGVLLGTLWLFVVSPKGFIPTEDTGTISGTVETAEGTSYETSVEHIHAVEAVARQDPNVRAISISSSGGWGAGANQSRMSLYLKPRGQRLTADEVIHELGPKLNRIAGVRVFLQNPPAIRVGGRSSKSLYQFTLQSADLETLYQYSDVMVDKLNQLPDLQNVTSDLQIKNPSVQVQINRERAASLGVSPDQIESALYNAYGSRQISSIYTPTNEYEVIIELLPQYQRNVSALNMLYIHSSTGALVPLASVATMTPTVGPLSINHSGQLPSVTVSFDLRPGASLSTGVAEIQRVARTTLPANVTASFSGTAQAFQQSQSGLLFLLVLAIVVIYLVLGILYESFIHPLTILSALPFAAFGALVALMGTRTELDVYAYVGVIMLVGLVKKNGIMMIDFALEAQRREHKAPQDAIVQACLIRFRPIMMTTFCALMGTLPIAIGFGAGSESRRPLGIAVVGGLAFSQIVTLYVTPVIYTYLDSFQAWLAARAARRRAAPRVAAPVLGTQAGD
jgi:HAE1 family hydrophobic/amphiphilic exporter-1